MEGKPSSANINRVYEDIEPSAEWEREEACDTLLVYLHGFRKENLRIQVTSSRNIRVFGERALGHDNKWQRFRREFPIPVNCDTNDITARFENGILYVKLPKTIAPAVVESRDKPQKPPTTTEAPRPPATGAPKPPKEAPKPPAVEAPKPPAVEAPKPPKEAPKPPTTATPTPQKPAPTTEAPRPQKPISTSDLPQPQQRTNANQEQNKKSDGGSHYVPEVPPRAPEKEKEPIHHPSTVKKSTDSHALAEATNAAAKKLEDNLAKKVEEDSTKEEYKRAIFGHENTAGGVDRCYRAQGYNYKQVLQGLIMELKQQPRKLVNLGLAFLFILVLGFYVKHAITFVREFKREEL
ncbi:hypothetical protein C1H46_028936 [Malus baccata]|uniref:SHSP domain-containing protein n=1 Tax=Malus baccata TaxID=106549 RepID=A0A540LGD5_MALBA|nr:hypothetical protein C1H46_028936 [Malus baccata]